MVFAEGTLVGSEDPTCAATLGTQTLVGSAHPTAERLG